MTMYLHHRISNGSSNTYTVDHPINYHCKSSPPLFNAAYNYHLLAGCYIKPHLLAPTHKHSQPLAKHLVGSVMRTYTYMP